MEVRAVAKYVRVQPLKVRQVAREVKGKMAVPMVHALRFHPSKGARALRKVLVSAIANAQENHQLDIDSLKISGIEIDEGPKLKRITAKAMGRAGRIFKRTSHITVVVSDVEVPEEVKPHGTKAKPRPSLTKLAKKPKKAEKVAEEPKAESTNEDVKAEEATTEEVVAETTEAGAETTEETK